MDLLRRHLMLAFNELLRAAVARLEGGPDYVPQGLPLDALSAKGLLSTPCTNPLRGMGAWTETAGDAGTLSKTDGR